MEKKTEEEEVLESGDEESDAEGDASKKTITLTKVFDNIKAPWLYYGEVSQRPWNPRYPRSYPSSGVFSTFCGFPVSKEAERRDRLGVPINQKYVDAMRLLFRMWSGGTGFDQDTLAPAPGQPDRTLHADSADIKRFAQDHEYYWAYRVHYPNKASGVVYIIHGYGNTWKSAGLTGLLRMFGPRHVKTYTNAAQFDERFTGPVEALMFRLLEEGGDWLREAQESRMKGEADKETIEERLMHREPRDVKNCMCYLIPCNTLKGIRGDHSSGNRKLKISTPFPIFSAGHPGRWYGDDPQNVDIDAASKINEQMLCTLIEDPEFPIEVYRHLNNLDIGDWIPAKMHDTPATKKLKQQSAAPIILFLKYLGEEYTTNVFYSEDSNTKQETDRYSRELRSLESLQHVYRDFCKSINLKPEGSEEFKQTLTGLMESVGVEKPYVRVRIHREDSDEAPIVTRKLPHHKQACEAMVFHKLSKDVTKLIIQQHLDPSYDWPALEVDD